jgi:hypothetical protein
MAIIFTGNKQLRCSDEIDFIGINYITQTSKLYKGKYYVPVDKTGAL